MSKSLWNGKCYNKKYATFRAILSHFHKILKNLQYIKN